MHFVRQASRSWWKSALSGITTLSVVCSMGAAAGMMGTLLSASPTSAAAMTAPKSNATASFTAHGSIGQVYVLGATPGESLLIVNKGGDVVGRGAADRLGSLVVRTLPSGSGYTVRAAIGSKVYGTPSFSVLSPTSPPASNFYKSQSLKVGINYLKMRTGITLMATLRLPAGKTITQGPFPTVIEETGYPDGPGTLVKSLLNPKTKTALAPTSATAVGSALGPILGFASVALQMRGAGCSGGAYDLFGLPTTYDGYDAVQIVGSQKWVLHNKVGLVGISYSGISQMFIGGTRPPDLAAITPLSTTNDLYTTGFPGGIFNSGFAGTWLETRVEQAKPATTPNSKGIDSYTTALIAQGTKQCAANQKLHLQTQNLEKLLKTASHRTPKLYDQRSPSTWAAKVKVPVFMVGAFEDEETGPQWPAIIPYLKSDKTVFVEIQNGTHVTSLGPGAITRWLEFLEIYVADKVPSITPAIVKLSKTLYAAIASTTPSEPLPAIRFGTASSAATAKRDFQKNTPRVRVLFDNGGGSAGPGAMQPVWTAKFTAWPPPKAVATKLLLGVGGKLTASNGATGRLPSKSSGAAGVATFHPNPTARPASDLTTGNVWSALPPFQWTPVTGSEGVGFISAPLQTTMVVVGPGSLNIELKSSATDTDLAATVTEVYPTGKEMYVESGQLRATDRSLTKAASTVLRPVPTYLASTAQSLPSGKDTLVRIPINPMGHAFRRGDRIRVVISAPGGSKPAWTFTKTTLKTGGSVVDSIKLGGSGAGASTLVLPMIPKLTSPDPKPACPSLRGEPCRKYVPAGNGG